MTPELLKTEADNCDAQSGLSPAPLLGGTVKYQVIYADPPWRYQDAGCNGNAEGHYNTMSLADIKALPVASIAADDAVLLMWATWPLLPEALQVIEAWGFKYRTCAFVWVKQNAREDNVWLIRNDLNIFSGLGRWVNGNAELCLFAKRGSPKRHAKNVKQIVLAPRGKHSAKPAEVRDRIVQLLGDVPRIELFARNRTPGWDAFGNEVESDVVLVPPNDPSSRTPQPQREPRERN